MGDAGQKAKARREAQKESNQGFTHRQYEYKGHLIHALAIFFPILLNGKAIVHQKFAVTFLSIAVHDLLTRY